MRRLVLLAIVLGLLAAGLLLWLRPTQPRPLEAVAPAPVAGPIATSSQLVEQAMLTTHRSNLTFVGGYWTVAGTTGRFTGLLVDTYPRGEPRSRTPIVEGQAHGLSVGWFTNGQQQVAETFVQGTSHGPRIKWYEDGVTQSVANMVSGRVDGIFRRWHPDGSLAEELSLRADVPHGRSRAYFPSGYLRAESVMNEGTVVTQRYWRDGEQAGLKSALR